MNPTREQVIQMAKDAGFVGYGEDAGDYNIPAPAFISRLGRVIEAAHAQALEDAAKVCDKESDNWDDDCGLIVAAKAIRALKGKQ